MKKLILSLAALGALSTAALADRSYDLRESDTYFGKYAQTSATTASSDDAAAFAVPASDAPMTNFERLTQQSIENESNR